MNLLGILALVVGLEIRDPQVMHMWPGHCLSAPGAAGCSGSTLLVGTVMGVVIAVGVLVWRLRGRGL